jgi:SAM-dependent methyltransferase
MRAMPFCGVFDTILSFFTTFGYFESSTENLRTLKSIEQSLRPGGVFVQDYLNKSFVINNVVARDERYEDGLKIVQERNYNKSSERIEKKITIYDNGETREYFESVRLYTLQEMQQLLADTELSLEQTYGDFDGQPFTDVSPRLILIGRRREDS